jgi:hypothetical protein
MERVFKFPGQRCVGYAENKEGCEYGTNGISINVCVTLREKQSFLSINLGVSTPSMTKSFGGVKPGRFLWTEISIITRKAFLRSFQISQNESLKERS